MITAIIQARMSSTRFPGKVLEPLLGAPMLIRQIDRVLRANCLDKIVVATSSDSNDDEIMNVCQDYGIACERGSLNDVLSRFYDVATKYRADIIVRLTADCPLLDSEIIDTLIARFCEGSWDYLSNTLEPTFPDGLDIEVFSYNTLETAWREARLPSEREHVTPYMKVGGRFKISNFRNSQDLSQYRWTVDEPVDFELITQIYSALFQRNRYFTMQDVLKFLSSRPDLLELNKHISRDEGYCRSLSLDIDQQNE